MREIIRDESLVPSYILPDPLLMNDGRKVSSVSDWQRLRRPELLELFREHVYGHSPARPRASGRRIAADQVVMGGKAVRRFVQVEIAPGLDGAGPLVVNLMMYLPAGSGRGRGPSPMFLNLNFNGNHSVEADPSIPLCGAWMLQHNDTIGVENHRANDKGRGSDAASYPLDLLIGKGFGLATCCYTEIEPDHSEGWRDSLRGRIAKLSGTQADWGAMGAWAWGLQCCMDYLEADGDVDAKRVAVVGHSRLGKAALWAAAQDERFAAAISNDSGEGGAALSKRCFGETVEAITRVFPHWFASKFREYADNEQALPVDQHELIALMAPRPMYIASATEDLWADPRGEFLAGVHAESVYRLFGKTGLGTSTMPPADTPVGRSVRYHLRTGKHAMTRWDWERYVEFCERNENRDG